MPSTMIIAVGCVWAVVASISWYKYVQSTKEVRKLEKDYLETQFKNAQKKRRIKVGSINHGNQIVWEPENRLGRIPEEREETEGIEKNIGVLDLPPTYDEAVIRMTNDDRMDCLSLMAPDDDEVVDTRSNKSRASIRSQSDLKSSILTVS